MCQDEGFEMRTLTDLCENWLHVLISYSLDIHQARDIFGVEHETIASRLCMPKACE